MGRKHSRHELWDRLFEFVRQDDGMLVYECGSWTIEKLHFLTGYLATTTAAMVGHRTFSSVNYIDLFASCGVCRLRDGTQYRYPGSALIAAGCAKPFNTLFLVEQDSHALAALLERIRRLGCKSEVRSWCADVNQVVDQISATLPGNSLNIAFIDPFGLDIHFETIRRLAEARPLDLIILFADAMDIARNVVEYYYPGKSDKLDLFLGQQSNWRDRWNQLNDQQGGAVCQFFATIYFEQLSKLGYNHTRTVTISSDRGPLYRLVYASKHGLGLKFWDIAINEGWEGTKTLWE